MTRKPNKRGLPTLWANHLAPDSRENFHNLLLNTHADPVFKRLRDIIDQELTALDRKEITSNSYDNAAWPYLQAHRNGQRQTLQFLKDLLKLQHDPV